MSSLKTYLYAIIILPVIFLIYVYACVVYALSPRRKNATLCHRSKPIDKP